MEPIKQLDHKINKFEDIGFFVEYIVESKLIGTKIVEENESGKIGYESTQHFTATEDILLKNKKIKKGTNYYTRIYPLCGRPIKKDKNQNLEIMSKFGKKLHEASNYFIKEDGTITNSITELTITPKDGSVRLTVDGKRKSFKVNDLLKSNFPLLSKTTTKEVPPAPKAQEPKSRKESDQPKKFEDKKADSLESKSLEKFRVPKKKFKEGQVLKMMPYRGDKLIDCIYIKHSTFPDGYPGVLVKIETISKKDDKEIKKTITKLVSISNIENNN